MIPPALRALGTLLLLTVFLAAPALHARAAATPPTLQAHGSDERLWLARVEQTPGKTAPGEVTTLFVREKFRPEWRRLDPINAPVLGMGSRGTQLAILLPGGDLRLTTDPGFASARPLPDGARVIALGSDTAALWAVGYAPAGSTHSTTQAFTTRSAAATTTTAPATSTTSAAAARLLLYKLGPQGWQQQGSLPGEILPSEDVVVSLGVSAGMPVVAHQVEARTVRLHRYVQGQPWAPVDDVKLPAADVQDFKLLGGTPTPVLWMRGATGPARLWLGGAAGKPAVMRDVNAPDNVPHAVAYANGDIRVLWVEDGKAFEQRLHQESGQAVAEPAPLPLPAESIVPAVWRWAQVVLTVALVFALAASLRRRREMQEIEPDPAKLRLAPFSTRFTAGVIDALPLIGAFGFALSRPAGSPDAGPLLALGAGVAAYLLLTTVVEAVAGRSLGKLLTGLYVVGLDGKPAGLGARVMRNLLRVIDIPVMPLALILFSPLRQRAGDLAAGTLVVRGKGEEDAGRAASDEARAKKDADPR